MKNKILTLLGFAAKANKLSYGMDMTVASIKSKRAKLAIVSFEISEKSQKEINYFSERNGVNVIKLADCSIDEITRAVGRRCGIVSVNDRQFASAIVRQTAEGGNV